MSNALQEVRKVLDKLPKNATYEEIQYHIYVRAKIELGLQDIKAGRVVSQEEAEKRMRKWRAK
jgi:predicted transcriptional regulator